MFNYRKYKHYTIELNFTLKKGEFIEKAYYYNLSRYPSWSIRYHNYNFNQIVPKRGYIDIKYNEVFYPKKEKNFMK